MKIISLKYLLELIQRDENFTLRTYTNEDTLSEAQKMALLKPEIISYIINVYFDVNSNSNSYFQLH